MSNIILEDTGVATPDGPNPVRTRQVHPLGLVVEKATINRRLIDVVGSHAEAADLMSEGVAGEVLVCMGIDQGEADRIIIRPTNRDISSFVLDRAIACLVEVRDALREAGQ